MREALASWHIGQVIRAYRHHPHHGPRPLSQELVASWLRLTQTQLSRAENGLPVKDLDKLTNWAQTLKIPARHLWFQLPRAAAGVVSNEAGSETLLSSALSPAGTLPHLPARAGPQPEDDGADAAAMRAFRTADLRAGGGHLYPTVVNYLQTAIAPRLFGTVTGGPGVFAAASALTEMAGWMAHDAGRDEPAQQHFTRALDLAGASSDTQLSAHILASMSHLALHHDRPKQAIQLARQGQQALGADSPNPGLAARLLTMEARALATLPQPEPAACGKALLRAEQMLGNEAAEQPSPWISQFDEGSLASEAARCLHQLGQMAAAARQAQRIIELRPGSHTRSRAFGQLLLASALIAQSEPEQACTLIQEVLDATQSLSSYLVIQQLRELGRLLEPHQANQAVAALCSRLHNALRQRLWLYPWLAPVDQHGSTPAKQRP
jgi:tetratricopeptide (TPR) repeat protein/transcriptional regulator with XRE-family HTH domain